MINTSSLRQRAALTAVNSPGANILYVVDKQSQVVHACFELAKETDGLLSKIPAKITLDNGSVIQVLKLSDVMNYLYGARLDYVLIDVADTDYELLSMFSVRIRGDAPHSGRGVYTRDSS